MKFIYHKDFERPISMNQINPALLHRDIIAGLLDRNCDLDRPLYYQNNGIYSVQKNGMYTRVTEQDQ